MPGFVVAPRVDFPSPAIQVPTRDVHFVQSKTALTAPESRQVRVSQKIFCESVTVGRTALENEKDAGGGGGEKEK